MNLRHWLHAMLIASVVVSPASAGLGSFFSRKPKVDPAEQVPALIMQLKTNQDEGKRSSAAEDLRNYDPKSYPEIMTVLADALLKDNSPAVRSEAASTIARLRPIQQQAGYALEQAAANDPSLRVRMAARQSLWQYNLMGYRSAKPAAETEKPAPAVTSTPVRPHTSAKQRQTRESPEPPLADEPPQPSPVAPPKTLTPPLRSVPIKPAPKKTEPKGPSLGSPD